MSALSDTLFERTFLSKYVYQGYGDRAHWHMDEVGAEHLCNLYKEKGIWVILKAPPDILKRRMEVRGDESHELIESIDAIQDRYMNFAVKNNIWMIDTSKQSIEDTVADIALYYYNKENDYES